MFNQIGFLYICNLVYRDVKEYGLCAFIYVKIKYDKLLYRIFVNCIKNNIAKKSKEIRFEVA